MPLLRPAALLFVLWPLGACGDDPNAPPAPEPARTVEQAEASVPEPVDAWQRMLWALDRLREADDGSLPRVVAELRAAAASGQAIAPEVAVLLSADDEQFAWLREITAVARRSAASATPLPELAPTLAAGAARLRGHGKPFHADLARAITSVIAVVDLALAAQAPAWLQSLASKAELPDDPAAVECLLAAVPEATAERLFGVPNAYVQRKSLGTLRFGLAHLPGAKPDLLWTNSPTPGTVRLVPSDVLEWLGGRADTAAALRHCVTAELAPTAALLRGRSCTAAIEAGYRLTLAGSPEPDPTRGVLRCESQSGQAIDLPWRTVAVVASDDSVEVGVWVEPADAAAGHRLLVVVVGGLLRVRREPRLELGRGPGSMWLAFE